MTSYLEFGVALQPSMGRSHVVPREARASMVGHVVDPRPSIEHGNSQQTHEHVSLSMPGMDSKIWSPNDPLGRSGEIGTIELA